MTGLGLQEWLLRASPGCQVSLCFLRFGCAWAEVASSRTAWSTLMTWDVWTPLQSCPVVSLGIRAWDLGAQRPATTPPSPPFPQHASHDAFFSPPVQVARWEQKTRKLSRALGSPYLGCYALGGVILLLNVLRSHW